MEEWKGEEEAAQLPSESESSILSVSDSGDDSSWIQYFCCLRGNEFFCEVEEDFIEDSFNLTGLPTMVPHFDLALDTILDVETPGTEALTLAQEEDVETAAELLYGLIHARYVLSNRGLQAMTVKFENVDFGRCPRVLCEGQPMLPVGQSDVVGTSTVNVFCPRCCDIFFPRSVRQGSLDGAFFGTTLPHLFMLRHGSSLVPVAERSRSTYIPRIYGFRIHGESEYWAGRLS